MRKILAMLLCLMMLLCGVATAEEATPALTKDVVVLFTSDIHCGIDQGWGLTGVAAIRDGLSAKNHVLLVDNGDAVQGETIGTLTNGSAVIELMNTAGYDIATIGNHEFDYGMENFLELAKKANFPYISANFNYKGELVFDPYIIKEFDGVKIAFVGVTTPNTLTSSTPVDFQDENGEYVYGFCQDTTGEKLYAAVQSAVDAARAEGATYVVVMGHMGNEASCEPWMSIDVIENTTGIDAFLDGHAHETNACNEVKNKEGKGVLRVACGTKLSSVGYLRIATDGKLATGLYNWTADIAAPELLGLTGTVADAVNEQTAKLDEIRKTVVASAQIPLYVNDPVATDSEGKAIRIVRNAETNLGDLCADAYRNLSGADIAFVNGGGIRKQINAGDITLDDIYSVHPFGNTMCIIRVTGQQVLDALEWGSRDVPGECGGFLQVSGLTYEIHTGIASSAQKDENGMFAGVTGEYRVKNVMVGGEPLDLEKTYTLASHNYMLLNQGDGYAMFAGAEVLGEDLMIDNQVLITYITNTLGGVVGEQYANPYGEGRIVAVPAE